MSLVCPHCHRTLEFAGARPSFCGYCGQRLGDGSGSVTVEEAVEPVTLPRPPGETEIVSPRPPASPSGDNVPESVGSYRLIRRLGGGGMGTVYEAADIGSGRRVALKLVQPEHAAAPEAIQRFRREGELASKLSHPRCVFVLAADEDRGRPYIVMELMTGITLADLVKVEGPLPLEQALAKILDVIEGLHEAHQHGLIHRDVKPSNCFVEGDGRVKVGDFGLAKSLLQPAHLTRTGTFVGTPLFAAPEQIKMEAVDARSDVYSVAATLYFLLTGQAPFQTPDATATLARIMGDSAPSMRLVRPELPKGLDKVVLRGLERERKKRWRSLDELRQALRFFMPAEPSVGSLGLRVVAYFLDSLILLGPNLGLQYALTAVFKARRVESAAEILVPLLLEIAYFGFLEGAWGWSLGKRLVRLRVGTLAANLPPGLGRAMLRATVFYVLLVLGDWVGRLLVVVYLREGVDSWQGSPRALGLLNTAISYATFGSGLLGLGLMAYTMRKRNGYRGLHEFLSGTRTYRLRFAPRRTRLGVQLTEFQLDLQQPPGLPERIGAYQIQGELRSTSEEQVLLGEDLHLHRSVWLWVRPETAPALNEERRTASRATRVRWLSCGRDAGKQWDAFLAPSGRPLPALVADGRRLSWAEFRGILEDLTDELRIACADATVPPTLAPHQVWIGLDGRVKLFETPLGEMAPPTFSAGRWDAGDETRSVAFLGEVAVLALEGTARPPDAAAGSIRAPLPLYAAELLNGLLSQRPELRSVDNKGAAAAAEPVAGGTASGNRLDRMHADLLATQSEPAQMTALMRVNQLVGHAMFAFLGLMGVLSFVFALPALLAFDLDPVGEQPATAMTIGTIAFGVVLFFVLAFVTWGGFHFLWEDIAIVRPDGRRASRIRCFCRTILAWGFLSVVVLLMSVGVAALREIRWLGSGMVGLAFVLVVGYLAQLFRNPARAPHDYLAGTYLVPK